MKKISLLGSTGSIGRQVLSLVKDFPDKFKITALAANTSTDLIKEQAEEFKPLFVAVADETKKGEFINFPYKVGFGEDAVSEAALIDSDIVVGAIVGVNGLKSTAAAIKAGKSVALANKETLVTCGKYITEKAAETGAEIIPVDSEHSAVMQCLSGGRKKDLKRIILTASGGPFYGAKSTDELICITPEQAVKHPNWKMGRKISVDSATMMNKGLEIIEASWLFDTKSIDYIIHPQSIVHSMVEFNDSSIVAQMAVPDMRLAILYALTKPERWESPVAKYDFSKKLEFFAPDEEVFPMPILAKESMNMGGTASAVLNSANEAAVELFLQGKIHFTDIYNICEHTLYNTEIFNYSDEDDILDMHKQIYSKIIRDNS